MSKKLDKEEFGKKERRKPAERAHGKKIRTPQMSVKLNFKIMERKKSVGVIKPLLVFAVRTLHLAVMSRRIWADQFVSDPQFGSSFLKKCR